jgi:hypothetical protein
MRRFIAPVLAVAWAAGASLPVGAATYFASPLGSDANNGSMSAPWRTLQAAKKILKPGDTLLIADGDYPGGVVHNVDGQPGKPITYKAINPGRAILHGDQTTLYDVFTVREADYVVVDGLVLRDGLRVGMYVANSCNVTVRNCFALNNRVTGLFSGYSDDLLFENNECAFNREQHGIYFSNSGDRPVIRYNNCHDNGRCGIQLNGDGKLVRPQYGTRGDGIIMRAVVDSNIIYNNGAEGGAGINLFSVREGVISNNLIYNNLAGGIALYNDNLKDATQWGSKNNLIVGNTIHFRPTEGRWCLSFRHGSCDNVVQNNILSGGYRGAYQFDDTSPFKADNNLLYSAKCNFVAVDNVTGKFLTASVYQSRTGNDLKSVYSEPKFAGVPSADFHLLSGSPAIGAGILVQEVSWDLEGHTISQSCKPDIGCYGGASAANAISTSSIGP